MIRLPPISFAFYQRMNARERVLSAMVAGTVFILLNLFALRFLFGAFGDLNAEYSEGARALREETFWARSQPAWEQRMRWLQQKQPVLVNRDRAPTQLLEQVQGAARASQVLIRSQQLRGLGNATLNRTAPTEYQAVSIHVETESDWKQLVGQPGFLPLLQKPENFIVFNLASMHSDPSDPKRMNCAFDVAKWDAPAAK
jgi:hypothetical protein